MAPKNVCSFWWRDKQNAHKKLKLTATQMKTKAGDEDEDHRGDSGEGGDSWCIPLFCYYIVFFLFYFVIFASGACVISVSYQNIIWQSGGRP